MKKKLFRNGNSVVLAVPKHMLDEMKAKAGSEVNVDWDPAVGMIVTRSQRKSLAHQSLTPEFKSWLDQTTTRHTKLIQNLAKR